MSLTPAQHHNIVTASVPPSLNCQNWVCFSEKPGVFRNTAICWLELGPIISVNRNWKLCPVSFWQFRLVCSNFATLLYIFSVTTSASALHYNLNWMLAGRCAVNAMVNIKMTLQISRFSTNKINVFSPSSILILLHRRNIQCVSCKCVQVKLSHSLKPFLPILDGFQCRFFFYYCISEEEENIVSYKQCCPL